MCCPILSSKYLLPMPCWSFHERHYAVAWLVRGKGGGIVIAFVLVHLLSRCHVVCAGHLLQHGGIRQDCLYILARHCLFLRMSGGVIPLTTGSMKVGVGRMHPDTSRRPLFRAASSRCMWALRHHTGEQHLAGANASADVDV